MTLEETWFWLSSIPEIWQEKTERLIDVYGDIREVFFASEKSLSSILSKEEAAIIYNPTWKKNFFRKYDEMKKQGIYIVYPGHKEYPERFHNIPKPPYALYVRGKMLSNQTKSVAIVGSRNPSTYGLSMAENLSRNLAKYGIATISGMARGIDGTCHMGSLSMGGETYGILGCGVDICYPKEHNIIYQQCIEQGGLISEYPLGSSPLPWRFPFRNRLISGLADLLVVIEAREKSGTLSTVDWALDQGKTIFALPGRLTDESSKGCNRLIREGAHMLMDIEDILVQFKMEKKKDSFHEKLSKEEQIVFGHLDVMPESIEMIANKCQFDSAKTGRILTALVMRGYVGEAFKCYFRKKV